MFNQHILNNSNYALKLCPTTWAQPCYRNQFSNGREKTVCYTTEEMTLSHHLLAPWVDQRYVIFYFFHIIPIFSALIECVTLTNANSVNHIIKIRQIYFKFSFFISLFLTLTVTSHSTASIYSWEKANISIDLQPCYLQPCYCNRVALQ